VMAARNPSGEVRSYPAARNHHENQILAWSVLRNGGLALRGDFRHATRQVTRE
jgi:phosphoribosylaminoimidazole carboxylase (NCAIR synthetase)